jgi:hypothetical protein
VETVPGGNVEPTGPAMVAVPAAKHGELNTTVTAVPENKALSWPELTIVAEIVAEPPAPIDAGATSSLPDSKELPLPLPIANPEFELVPVLPVPVVLPVELVPVPTNGSSPLPPHEASASAASRTVVIANFRM